MKLTAYLNDFILMNYSSIHPECFTMYGKTILGIGRGGSQDCEMSRQSAQRWQCGCQPYAPTAIYVQGRFLIPIFVRD